MARDREALRALLGNAIDYAGLFPPAKLSMRDAVASYAEHRRDDAAWALGRFVVPATRFEELIAARREVDGAASGPWGLSALLGADIAGDAALVRGLNARDEYDRAAMRVEAVELRAESPEAIHTAVAHVPNGIETYVEVALDRDLDTLLAAVRDAGAMAKARTGGITADAFPTPRQLARFLATCVGLALPFKVTAGLHHPLRDAYRLTYEAESPRAVMFGFLNVFLATAFLASGADEAFAQRVLEETDPASLTIDDAGIAWRGRRLTAEALASVRRSAVRSFGSCSFREPVDELAALAVAP
jgi:hypothetical protein